MNRSETKPSAWLRCLVRPELPTIIIMDRPISWKQLWRPKTKKRRIQNKWNDRVKKPSNFTPVFLAKPMMMTDPGTKRMTIIATARQAEQLRCSWANDPLRYMPEGAAPQSTRD